MINQNQSYSPIKKQGLLKYAWSLFKGIVHKTTGLGWETRIFLERSLAEPVQEIEPEINVTVKQATKVDLSKFQSIVDKHQYNGIQQDYRKGRICFIVLDGEKAAAFAWMSLEGEEGRVKVKLNDKEAYFFNDYVVPEYRNNRFQSALIAARLMYLHFQAYDKAIVAIVCNDIYSLKAYMFAGFRPKRVVTQFTIFGLKFHRWQKYSGPL